MVPITVDNQVKMRKTKMSYLTVSGTFNLIGTISSDLHESLVRAVESVPQAVFFDENGKTSPKKIEVAGVDKAIADTLKKYKWNVQENCPTASDCDFNVDLAIPQHKVLIEIEKGTNPRLELDILKIASACFQYPERWQFGTLIVPSSYIKLRLEGRQSPYEYLRRLARLIKPILTASLVKGFLVIGYGDPRTSN
jgi:hypothetical protein